MFTKNSPHQFQAYQVKLFCLDLDAMQIAEIVELNRNTAITIYWYWRTNSRILNGNIAWTKVTLLVNVAVKEAEALMVKSLSLVCSNAMTRFILNCAGCEREDASAHDTGSCISRLGDSFGRCRGYAGLIGVGFEKHFRVDHGKGEYARGMSYINGIEGFWASQKRD